MALGNEKSLPLLRQLDDNSGPDINLGSSADDTGSLLSYDGGESRSPSVDTASIYSLASGYETDYTDATALPDAGTHVSNNKLGMGMGVIVPTCNSILGVVMFIRFGFIIGQAGFWQLFSIFVLSSLLVILTALSLSAISTNGAIRGGGVYYMISRALGPAFGGSVGVIFFVGLSVGVAFNLFACSDVLVQVCGGPLIIKDPNVWDKLDNIIISSLFLIVLTGIALLGASVVSKFQVVFFISTFLAVIMGVLALLSRSGDVTPGFTGPSWNTFTGNLSSNYSSGQNWITIFQLFFPSVTGIMAGANMSGDLRNPDRSIPKGTLISMLICAITYIAIILPLAFTVSNEILRDATPPDSRGYFIFQKVCWSPWIVIQGIWISAIASALGNVVGAARVLQALARDKVIPFLSVFAPGYGIHDNPIRATLLTYGVVQCFLFAGSLDAIAPLQTNFFLVAYGLVNLSVVLLVVSGTPNFRPTFRYFSWYSTLAGCAMCVAFMFFNPIYALVTLSTLFIIFLYISLTFKEGTVGQWGDVAQALLFHQVRKYLLKVRSPHVKNWRPNILLLLHPLEQLHVVAFGNSLKKGGLFIIAQVLCGDFSNQKIAYDGMTKAWDDLITHSKLKAFSQILLSPTVVMGMRAAILTAGIGALKPNMILMGFHKGEARAIGASPSQQSSYFSNDDDNVGGSASAMIMPLTGRLPGVDQLLCRGTSNVPSLNLASYLVTMHDAFQVGNAVLIHRYLERLPLLSKKIPKKSSSRVTNNTKRYIDVWLYDRYGDVLQSREDSMSIDLALQLGAILSSTRNFKKLKISLRVNSIIAIGASYNETNETLRIQGLITRSRISAKIRVFRLVYSATPQYESSPLDRIAHQSRCAQLKAVNVCVIANSVDTCVLLLPFYRPPEGTNISDETSNKCNHDTNSHTLETEDEQSMYYVEQCAISDGLPPLVMVFGESFVTTAVM